MFIFKFAYFLRKHVKNCKNQLTYSQILIQIQIDKQQRSEAKRIVFVTFDNKKCRPFYTKPNDFESFTFCVPFLQNHFYILFSNLWKVLCEYVYKCQECHTQTASIRGGGGGVIHWILFFLLALMNFFSLFFPPF